MGSAVQHEKQKLLTERLKGAARAYYDEDAEVMSNLEYDRLYDELAALEAESGVVFAGSPTQRVGYEVSSALAKRTHASPMLSLNKTKEISELEDWLGDRAGLLSYKLDGLTIALTYEGGMLQTAVTRGNGLVGEVVTNNARTFVNLPARIPFTGTLTLRGEAVIRYDDFEKINHEIEDVDARYKNPRNLVSGSVRQLDSAVTAKRHVRFYAFALARAEGASAPAFATRTEQMDFLGAQGFEAVAHEWIPGQARDDNGGQARDDNGGQARDDNGGQPRVTMDSPIKSANDGASCLALAVERFSASAREPGFGLPVDGLVLGFDDLAYAASLGATSKFPRDSIAFKWQDEEAETELLGIEWSASRTGLINPIAIFAPVELEGTTVSRASVHNVSILEELALGTGDHIKVYKANMIIPQIAENLTRSGTERPPDNCPVCGAVTELRDVDGVRTLHCTNADCPARRIKAFAHFVGRPALNIEGLSEQSLEKFIAAGLLHELADIFQLKNHRETIVTMEGFGEKSFENLVAAIDAAAARATADRALVSLGIPEIGSATAKAIARALGHDWDRIAGADLETLSATPGVGSVIADLYVRWFDDPKNRSAAEDLAAALDLRAQVPVAGTAQPGADPLAGLTFVITGSLENYANRDALKDRIEELGGKTAGSVSSKTDYLINNDSMSQSSKNKTAKSLGVKIITEAEFEAL
ncbi:MAG: NAD-dependent DNA ligase LigA [Clostridiales Family XIII bacterium]|jgi:DNA ligase (NAD+)|nr:NAD-dependent DNA ligase LigA [Clostridiales Family XIII bacterium]